MKFGCVFPLDIDFHGALNEALFPEESIFGRYNQHIISVSQSIFTSYPRLWVKERASWATSHIPFSIFSRGRHRRLGEMVHLPRVAGGDSFLYCPPGALTVPRPPTSALGVKRGPESSVGGAAAPAAARTMTSIEKGWWLMPEGRSSLRLWRTCEFEARIGRLCGATIKKRWTRIRWRQWRLIVSVITNGGKLRDEFNGDRIQRERIMDWAAQETANWQRWKGLARLGLVTRRLELCGVISR